MGILSTGQARHFALGGLQGDGVPPYKDFSNPTGNFEEIELPPPPLQNQLTKAKLTAAPPLEGYTMQGNVLGTNPYYSVFDNNSNGLNFSYDDRVKELPISQQSPEQIIINKSQQNREVAPNTLNVNGQQGTNYAQTSTALPQPGSDRQSFGNDYNAYLADAKKYQGKYRDAQSIDEAYNVGNISKEERDRLQLLSPEDLQKESNTTGAIDQEVNKEQANNLARFPFMNPLGSDFTSNMFQAGRAIRAPKGTPGRGLGIGLNLGAGLLEAARGIGSGMAYQNMNNQTRNYYDDMMKKRLYTNASQTQNANITGGVAESRYGGLFQNNHFALGGEQMAQEQMMQEQMSQQQMPQEEQAMAQEQAAPQDKIQKIAEQLVAGLGSLEAIDAYLKEQQVDEATYMAVMQAAQQMLEGQNQSQPAMEEAPMQEAPMEEAPTMRGGGKFKHRVGDKIEFTHKGKKHKGVIKKIENGQIYL